MADDLNFHDCSRKLIDQELIFSIWVGSCCIILHHYFPVNVSQIQYYLQSPSQR